MMNAQAEVAFAGYVVISTRCNLRQGAPSGTAPVIRKVESGTVLVITAMAVGDEIQGNAIWYRVVDGSYVWSGGCGEAQAGSAPIATAPPSAVPPPIAVTLPSGAGGIVPNVVDIYHGDNVTSFVQARNAGVLGVIHKATTGATGRDDFYKTRRALAAAAGLLWGAYHWGTAAAADLQVENFLSWAEPDANTLVALDFESSAGNQMSLGRAKEFLSLIEERLGRKAVLYSGNTLKEALGTSIDAFFGQHRLWLAQFSAVPQAQASWNAPWLWQFTSGKADDRNRRIVSGMPGNAAGELDCNNYKGDVATLQAEWAS